MSNLAAQLKEFLRALRADLAEKRLLPLVVLLAVAVIGIPVAFSVTASKSTPAPAAPAPVVAAGPGAAIAAAPPAQRASVRLGRLRDPFAIPGAKAAAATAVKPGSPITAKPPSGAAPTGATGPSGPTSPGNSVPASGTTGPSGPQPLKPTPSAVATRELEIWSVNYSFGQGTSVKTYNNALRLDAVPSNTTPVVQYLGVTKGGKSAAFLVWGPATASGDGTCIDGQTPCQVVELKPGETEFIDVIVPGAGDIQFEVDVLAITSKKAATQAEALKAHMLQSTAGVQTLSLSNATGLAKLKYSTVYGTLLPRPSQPSANPSSSTSGTGTSATARSATRPSSALGTHRVSHRAHSRRD